MRRKVVEWLVWQLEHEVDDAHFDMSSYLTRAHRQIRYVGEASIPHCKTAGCIAGTLFLHLPAEIRLAYLKHAREVGTWVSAERVAMEQLNCTMAESAEMFAPNVPLQRIKRQDAIKMLKHLLETSWIDWGEIPSPLYPGKMETGSPISVTHWTDD